MKKQINCIVEFHLNTPLKDGRTVLIDDHAKVEQMNNSCVKVSTHYSIPLQKVNSMTVSFVEGYNTRIIVNSGREKVHHDGHGAYDFIPPKTEYNGISFCNTGIEKHLRVRQEQEVSEF